jgi:uncharacterized protein YigE (DUF2233 family)
VPKFSVAFFAAVVLTQSALAEWEVVSANSESGASLGVEHRHIKLRDLDATATIDLAIFSPQAAMLRVIDNPGGSENLTEAMARGNFAAGVNGGYFDTKFKPIGLRVIDGVVMSPLIRARLLTGILCASSHGIAILRLREFSSRQKPEAAIECGPFLVDGGTRTTNLENRREARRTFAAVTRRGKAALGISTELTLAELGVVLANRSLANDFRVWRAMNLDGGSSSAFWFRKNDDRVFSISEDKSVRDFVGVIAK